MTILIASRGLDDLSVVLQCFAHSPCWLGFENDCFQR